MRKLIIPCLLFLAACSSVEEQQIGGIRLLRYAPACEGQESQFWLMDLQAWNSKDSLFINTKELKHKAELNTDHIRKDGSFYKVLQSICKGDSAELYMRADSFYAALGADVPPYLQKAEEIKVKINVKDRLDLMSYVAYKKVFEKESMKKYIKDFNWNATLDSSTGIYYEMLISDSSEYKPFNTAKFKYVLKNINEELIAFSKDEEPLIVDADSNGLIPGLKVLVGILKEGESLRALVPSSQAFGDQGNSKVRPFMPIVIELEYIERVD